MPDPWVLACWHCPPMQHLNSLSPLTHWISFDLTLQVHQVPWCLLHPQAIHPICLICPIPLGSTMSGLVPHPQGHSMSLGCPCLQMTMQPSEAVPSQYEQF